MAVSAVYSEGLTEFPPRPGTLTRLRLDIARHGYQWLPGEGRARSGDWPPEQSFLILGIPVSEARILGRRYGQLAIVVGRLGKKARLCRLPVMNIGQVLFIAHDSRVDAARVQRRRWRCQVGT